MQLQSHKKLQPYEQTPKLNPSRRAAFIKQIARDTDQYRRSKQKQNSRERQGQRQRSREGRAIFQSGLLRQFRLKTGREGEAGGQGHQSGGYEIGGSQQPHNSKKLQAIKKLLKINLTKSKKANKDQNINQYQNQQTIQSNTNRNERVNKNTRSNNKSFSNRKLILDGQIFNDTKIRSLERYSGSPRGRALAGSHNQTRNGSTRYEQAEKPRKVYASLEGLGNSDRYKDSKKAANYQIQAQKNRQKNNNRNIILILEQQHYRNISPQRQSIDKQKGMSTDKQQQLKAQIKQQLKIRNKLTNSNLNTISDTTKNKILAWQADEAIQNFQIKFQPAKKYGLNRCQSKLYGDRFPAGYKKIKLLGRGGFSLVWLGQDLNTGQQYAVKQILIQNGLQSHLKEIWFSTYFFQIGGKCKRQFKGLRGIQNLVKMHDYQIGNGKNNKNKNNQNSQKDAWIIYEKGGESLASALYELIEDEKIINQTQEEIQCMFKIIYKPLYSKIRENQNYLRKIILQIAKVLDLLQKNNIVHSDVKSQNVLIKYKIKQKRQLQIQQLNEKQQEQVIIKQVKLIDYGGCFLSSNLRQICMATPEYIPPQILNLILFETQKQHMPRFLKYLYSYSAHSLDIWSLGCLVLQIVSGIPLWMCHPVSLTHPIYNIQHIQEGLFASKQRELGEIIYKQVLVVNSLEQYLDGENHSGIKLQEDLRKLTKGMLELDPRKRVKASDIIKVLDSKLGAKK